MIDEKQLQTAVDNITTMLQLPTYEIPQVLKQIKEQGETSFRDIRYFMELGFPLYDMMKKRFFMIGDNPVPLSVLENWYISGKPMCVKGCISYNDLCQILIEETKKGEL